MCSMIWFVTYVVVYHKQPNSKTLASISLVTPDAYKISNTPSGYAIECQTDLNVTVLPVIQKISVGKKFVKQFSITNAKGKLNDIGFLIKLSKQTAPKEIFEYFFQNFKKMFFFVCFTTF